MGLFGPQASQAHQIADLADLDPSINKVDQIAEHARWTHHFLGEIKDALEQADPSIKYESATLDPLQEVVVRYERGRYRYAICSTEANLQVKAQWAGKQWTVTYVNPGWQALDYPPGTLLTSGDANRHFIIVRMSNLKT